MEIANGIYMLEISANILGKPSVINPTLIWDKDKVILIDTGFLGQLPQIRVAIEEVGVSFDQLNMVILTHQDIDQVGSLSSILKELMNYDIEMVICYHGGLYRDNANKRIAELANG